MHKCIQMTQSNPHCNTGNQSQKSQPKALSKVMLTDLYKLQRGFITLGTMHIHSKFLQEFTIQGPELQLAILQSTSTGEDTSVCLTRAVYLDTDGGGRDAEEVTAAILRSHRRPWRTWHVNFLSIALQFFFIFNLAQRFCRQVWDLSTQAHGNSYHHDSKHIVQTSSALPRLSFKNTVR